jgi:hypothetical protein
MISGVIAQGKIDKKLPRDVCGVVFVTGFFCMGFLEAENPIAVAFSRGVNCEY